MSKHASPTNKLTGDICEYFTINGILAWRENNAGIPVLRAGSVVGFRSPGIPGKPDIFAILALRNGHSGSLVLGIEIKTGKDRLRPEQVSFGKVLEKAGGLYWVIGNYEDFIHRIDKLLAEYHT